MQNPRKEEKLRKEKVSNNTRLLLRKDTQFFKKKALFVYGIKIPILWPINSVLRSLSYKFAEEGIFPK